MSEVGQLSNKKYLRENGATKKKIHFFRKTYLSFGPNTISFPFTK
jgi:hypothetical protein